MGLERYHQKRNFRVTPEPKGKVGKRTDSLLRFIIQKHAASRLHYDFRLELGGVLLSWAVPRVPASIPTTSASRCTSRIILSSTATSKA